MGNIENQTTLVCVPGGIGRPIPPEIILAKIPPSPLNFLDAEPGLTFFPDVFNSHFIVSTPQPKPLSIHLHALQKEGVQHFVKMRPFKVTQKGQF